jgi:hypothetical protein
MSDAYYLIVRKQRLTDEQLADHVRRLAERLGVDAYNLRLALRGDGLASLRYGDPRGLRELGQALTPLGYQWGVVEARRMEHEPLEVRRFDRQTNTLGFEGKFGRRDLRRGEAVVAVLAATQGDLISKLIRKSAYHGGKATALTDEEKMLAILGQGPVLDLYLLPKGASAADDPVALRVLPGRFDVASIGGDPLGGARQNFTHVLDEVRKLAGRFELDLDFGFSQLPGGGSDASNSPDAAERNRASVARYGHCVVELARQSPARPRVSGASLSPLDRLAAAGVAAGGAAGVAVGAAAGALGGAMSLRGSAAGATPRVADDDGPPLPPPPPSVREGWANDWRVWPALVYFGGYVLLGALAAFAKASSGAVAAFLFSVGFRYGLFFFAAAGLLFYEGFRFLRLRRLMADTPTSKARSAAVGMVEMAGHCERWCNLLSPLGQVPCVYYRLERFKRRQGKYGENQWQRVSVVNSGSTPFYLRDDTGRVLVNPAGAKIRAAEKRIFEEGTNSLFGVIMPVSPDDRYVEETIPEGAYVYVLGFAAPLQAERLPLRQRVADKLRALKMDRATLMRYDANHDGQIDQGEWGAARADAERAATAESLADGEQATRNAENIAIERPPLRGLPFVISGSTEKRLSAAYGWAMAAFLAAAVAVAAAGIAALLS